TTISDSMLEEVRTKDVGPAGEALNTMVSKLRELKFEDIDPTDKPNWFERIFGMGNNKLKEYLDQYETVREQIDTITNDLERHKTTLLTD
ncbi:MAG: toxic anion resistance protein, partial [Geminicoccaceae bacterium]|nr:toxic anion resistance protein [Geminicoccaceae bacterium]